MRLVYIYKNIKKQCIIYYSAGYPLISPVIIFANNWTNSVKDLRARELAKRLNGLPLALTTAGAYLSQVTRSLVNYLYYYNSLWLKL